MIIRSQHVRTGAVIAGIVITWLCPSSRVMASPAELDARQTVVVANRAVPESEELARYYMAARGIPTNQLCLVDLPAVETISRRIYDTKLRGPLQKFMREQGLIEQVRRDADDTDPNENTWRTVNNYVRYIVSVYGVPLRVAGPRPFFLEKVSQLVSSPYSRESAAVDSELACLLWETYNIKGVQPNSMYNEIRWPRNAHQLNPVLIAARLDGPSPELVRSMIDDAIAVEKEGLFGRAYIDMRSIKDPDYIMGDFWLNEAGERLKRAGYDVDKDFKNSVLPRNFPMDDTAVYLGWYSEIVQGPFLRNNFKFRPGAVAYHLHSASAKTLRSETSNWAGPLIAAGAAAVMGAVDEPYLPFTPDLQIFIDRLCSGFSFGESAYMAQRGLSWQITVVGDPLYRPFPAETKLPQVNPGEESSETYAWKQAAFMNRLASAQQLNQALKFGREVLAVTNSLIVREKLADLYMRNDLLADAVREYDLVIKQTSDEEKVMRLGHRLISILNFMDRKPVAEEVRKSITARWPDSPLLSYLDAGAI